MNAAEGLRRLALAIRYGGYGLGALMLAFGVVISFGGTSASGMAGSVIGGIVGCAFFAGIGHAISWVLLGFSEKR